MEPRPQFDSWRQLYPFESHFLTTAGGRYHFLDEGAGEPLLMVHGNPTWSFYWRNLVHAFQDRFRMVVPDHMGCGLSDKPQRYPYHLQQHIENLVALIEHLQLDRITLLAHDWGGAIGLGAALARSDRFQRLVLFNTGAFPPPFVPFRIRICRTPLLGTFAVRGLNLFARGALTMAVEKPLTDQVASGLLAPYDSWRNRIAIDSFVRDIPFTKRHRTWETLTSIESGLASLAGHKQLLIWGMRDWCFRPECLERIRTHWPDAEVHRIAHAGHYVLEDAAAEIVTVLEPFLGES